MKSKIFAIILVLLVFTGFTYWRVFKPVRVINRQEMALQKSSLSKSDSMKITSSAFNNQEQIPPKYTADGRNVNPPLSISGVPKSAKNLVLIINDPDAPAGTWTHWTVWNINPAVKEIAENSVPSGAVEGKTSFGKPGYGGPAPPSGTHRYFFKLYALDTKLDIYADASPEELFKAMEGHILDYSELIGIYSHK
ncbi:MAG: YbhB/YbcL family Raf kinase inhibitor-like protein [Firmicutes bacterium]|nr:YbhB/YbcL family Raf kinase inhibitor-like protein [Bacillota bacterium]